MQTSLLNKIRSPSVLGNRNRVKNFLKVVDKLPKLCYNITIVKENRKEKTMLMCELDVMEYAVTMEEALIEELNDFDDFYEEILDRYDECGYNPYMGCYDFDC